MPITPDPIAARGLNPALKPALNFMISSASAAGILVGFVAMGAATIVLLSSVASAQIATGPTSAAMGDAGLAAVNPGEVTWLNPASVAQVTGYYMSLGGSIEDHAADGNQKEYRILAADNEPDELMAGSLSYVHNNIRLDSGNIYEQDIQAAIAGQVLNRLSLGLSFHRLVQSVSIGSNQAQYDGTFGALWTPRQDFGLALVVFDFVPQATSVPLGLRLIPTVAVGANWVATDFLHLRLDVSHPTEFANDRTDIKGGLETFFNPKFAFRCGADFKETENQTWLTTGLAFLGPKLSLDYAFQKDVRQADGYRHLIDLWVPL